MKQLQIAMLLLTLAFAPAAGAQEVLTLKYKDAVGTAATSFQVSTESVRLIITELPEGARASTIFLRQQGKEAGPRRDNGSAIEYTLSPAANRADTFRLFGPQLLNGHPIIFRKPPAALPDGDGGTSGAGEGREMPLSGIAFWDALTMVKSMKGAGFSKETVRTLLESYDAYQNFERNIFFQRVPGLQPAADPLQKAGSDGFALRIAETGTTLQSAGGGAAIAGALGSLSGIDVTAYVQAFSDFLRDRVKEELVIAYISRLKKELAEITELKYLLPETYQVFNDGDVFKLPSMGPVYKEAFGRDLALLMEHFEQMVYEDTTGRYSALKNDDGFLLFLMSYRFTDLSAKGYHPIDVLRQLDGSYGLLSGREPGFRSMRTPYMLSTLNMLSQHLRDLPRPGDTLPVNWVSRLDPAFASRDFVNIFFGLLYAKYPALFVTDTAARSWQHRPLTDYLLAHGTDRIYELLSIGNLLDSRIREYKALRQQAATPEERKKQALGFFLSNAGNAVDLFKYALSFEPSVSQTSPQFKHWEEVLRSAIEVGKGLHSEDVAKVTTGSIRVIQLLLKNNTNMDPKHWQKVVHYTNFIADMATADSAAQIKAVLDRYAEPPRSYRAIRHSAGAVTLSAYPGLYYGQETTFRASGDRRSTVGITAPIGLAAHLAGKYGSHSAFLSLVDIGAPFSYRFNQDSTDLPQDIHLGQILSPGLFYVYGLPRSPLSFKLGMQYVPLLRAIRNDMNEVQNLDLWRISLGISVDIPVFIFSLRER